MHTFMSNILINLSISIFIAVTRFPVFSLLQWFIGRGKLEVTFFNTSRMVLGSLELFFSMKFSLNERTRRYINQKNQHFFVVILYRRIRNVSSKMFDSETFFAFRMFWWDDIFFVENVNFSSEVFHFWFSQTDFIRQQSKQSILPIEQIWRNTNINITFIDTKNSFTH